MVPVITGAFFIYALRIPFIVMHKRAVKPRCSSGKAETGIVFFYETMVLYPWLEKS